MVTGIINYGMGNINSVRNILSYLGVNYKVCNDFKEINNFSSLILPGVGSFKTAMINLNSSGLGDEIKEFVLTKKKKILGICLGMQLLGKSSQEDGLNEGLNLVQNRVTKFRLNNLRVYVLVLKFVMFTVLTMVVSVRLRLLKVQILVLLVTCHLSVASTTLDLSKLHTAL